MILGVSGSPVAQSNTDRGVMQVLVSAGGSWEFVKFNQYELEPCRACLGCLESNRCVLQDDGNLLVDKAAAAEALVVGGYAPYGSLDARTKGFLERLYPLRHGRGLMVGKPGMAVITCCFPDAEQPGLNSCQAAEAGIHSYMAAEQMTYVGGLHIKGNAPCARCGQEHCSMSVLRLVFGDKALQEDVMALHCVEEQEDVLEQAWDLGKVLRQQLSEQN